MPLVGLAAEPRGEGRQEFKPANTSCPCFEVWKELGHVALQQSANDFGDSLCKFAPEPPGSNACIQYGSGNDGAAARVAAAFTLRVEAVAVLVAEVADAAGPVNASYADASLASAVHVRVRALMSPSSLARPGKSPRS